ncbi:hypothetical protein BDP81DRAFT_96163 [Colletotrichum phormii]|uniref:Uncharacterized protein n=1 Tax=Colletotrichum phormii TaxID=359342 RepID=A0AAI9ZIV7_9PEZI|nr:uncharacterized protein BDP81DRAFT_96163 [Colletotrichum phormii]KAK1625392.1 hypothetical protein BDP81DRAFT_96163 [Colletotrichum phormii]
MPPFWCDPNPRYRLLPVTFQLSLTLPTSAIVIEGRPYLLPSATRERCRWWTQLRCSVTRLCLAYMRRCRKPDSNCWHRLRTAPPLCPNQVRQSHEDKIDRTTSVPFF